jgi:hypothetical protein
MRRYAVYVPTGERQLDPLESIKRGSGIVGSPWQHDSRQVVLDFEGNLYSAANIHTFADRVHHAWGRHSGEYPTIARMVVGAETVRQVGWYDPDDQELDVNDRAALAAWLDCDETDLDEELRRS